MGTKQPSFWGTKIPRICSSLDTPPRRGYSVHKCTQEKDRYLQRASSSSRMPPKAPYPSYYEPLRHPHLGIPKEGKRNIPRALSGRWCIFSSLWPRRATHLRQGSYIESYHGVDTIPLGATDLGRSCPYTELHRGRSHRGTNGLGQRGRGAGA